MWTKTLRCSALAALVLGACFLGAGAGVSSRLHGGHRPAAPAGADGNAVRLGHVNQWMAVRRCLERRSLWRGNGAPAAR